MNNVLDSLWIFRRMNSLVSTAVRATQHPLSGTCVKQILKYTPLQSNEITCLPLFHSKTLAQIPNSVEYSVSKKKNLSTTLLNTAATSKAWSHQCPLSTRMKC